MPIITFGIATRIQNQERERFLHKLINSIQKQTRSEREIILSDDNSSINVDYSEYSKDKRIKIFHQKESLGIF
jgi:glycosyltransferase involved in cell wall biosynthesis